MPSGETKSQAVTMFGDRREAYLEVAKRIEDLILRGTLMPGARLPSERDLCDQLGVGRPALREGLHILRERGLITVRKGQGHFVAPVNWESLRRSLVLYSRRSVTSVADVMELRRFIEIPTAGIAALRRHDFHLDKLKRSIAEMEQHLPQLSKQVLEAPELVGHSDIVETHIQLDIQFHITVAQAGQNPLILPILHGITDLIRKSMRADVLRTGGRTSALEHHRTILRHIEKQDAKEAEKAMDAHLRHHVFGSD